MTSFLKLPSGRFINMALVADVTYSDNRQYLNLYAAGGKDESPVPIVSLPVNSDDARAVLAWLNDHNDIPGGA